MATITFCKLSLATSIDPFKVLTMIRDKLLSTLYSFDKPSLPLTCFIKGLLTSFSPYFWMREIIK